jgi:hypothetical protein
MKETAVEFLYEALWEAGKDKFIWQIILQQAKEMEKEQMEELALYIYEYSVTCLEERINPDGKKKFEQYYNETFGKK